VIGAYFSLVRRTQSQPVHAPQHFLYFLPLPHGPGSFLPVLVFVLLISADGAAGLRSAFVEAWAELFTPLGVSS
jgi:hypothetical protein